MSSRQIRSSDHHSSRQNRSSNQRYSSSLISPGRSHEARFRKYSEKAFQSQKKVQVVKRSQHNLTIAMPFKFFSNFSFQKQRLNLREISVRILRSDTWKTTVPTLQFLGYAQARKPCSKGNAILKYQCFQSHILEQPASNFCEDGKHT